MLNPLFVSLGVTRDSFIGSHPFRFLIGPDKKTFYVHTELVAQHSSALGALVSGPMAEAKESCAILEDADEGTFVRFVEYMYTNDYSVPDPVIVQMASNSTFENGQDGIEETAVVDVPSSAPIEDDYWSFTSKKSKKKNKVASADVPVDVPLEYSQRGCKKDQLWSEFTEKAHMRHREPWEPRQNKESCEDYTQVFLCHARIYVFSDRYCIEPLQELARQKLRLTLSTFILFSERVSDIVELVQYTYAHTMEHEEGIDKLRSLVMDYVICQMEAIVKDKNFITLLQEPGALAKDLVLKSLRRLD
jgi:BTB/POZ domain